MGFKEVIGFNSPGPVDNRFDPENGSIIRTLWGTADARVKWTLCAIAGDRPGPKIKVKTSARVRTRPVNERSSNI